MALHKNFPKSPHDIMKIIEINIKNGDINLHIFKSLLKWRYKKLYCQNYEKI